MDSQHWYSQDGTPCYEQEMVKGGMRSTTLRDARKIGLVPSVTTILGVLAKPALINWLVNQGILAALTGTRQPDEPDEDYIRRILADSRQQAKDAADEGSRIHDACECAHKRLDYPPKYIRHASAALAELARLYPGVSDWQAEASFAHPSGFGGKCDLHSPSTGIVVDYKTKDGDFTDGKKLGWDQHWQLSAYNRGLSLPANEGAAIFISRTHPGKVASFQWTKAEIDEGWEVFAAALEVWKRLKRFDPAF